MQIDKIVTRILAILLAIALGFVVVLGIKTQKESDRIEQERLEFQSQIDTLNQQLLDREQAACLAVEKLKRTEETYKEETGRLQKKLQQTQEKYRQILKEIETLEAPELEDYFYQKYAEEFGWDEERFTLPVNVGNQIRYDLTDRDFCIEESDLKDSVLIEQTRYIDTLNAITEQVYAERNFLTGKIETLEQYSVDLENRNLLLKKNLKCQKVQKGIFITTTSILGILLISTLLGGSR